MLRVITIAITLVVIIGSTYAYFTSKVTGSENNTTTVNTKVLASAEMSLGNEIIAEKVLPGYKALKTIKVVGKGPENAVPIKAYITLTPEVTDFGSHIKYYLYETETKDNIDTSRI